MALLVAVSAVFFLTVAYIVISSALKTANDVNAQIDFLPKYRTEMIKGIAAVGIVIGHMASYSKGAAPSGIIRYYNLFCSSLGGIGVNLFFFISGYGNYLSIARARGRIRWLWKRCATIIIVYLICHLLVLAGLYAGGYRTTFHDLADHLLHLSISFSSVWYVKIQLLAYCFLALVSVLKDKRAQIISLAALCCITSFLLFKLGYKEEWWKSVVCFSVGAAVAAYRPGVEALYNRKKKPFAMACIALLPFAYAAAALIDAYPVKTVGNIVLCIVMMGLLELACAQNAAYLKLGAYSLQIYLIHRSFVAWMLNDGVTTNAKVALIIALTVVLTFVAKWLSDRITRLCFGRA